MPAAIPTNRASERSSKVPVPIRIDPMIRIEATGSRATTEVLIDRTSVWLTARLAASAYVRLVVARMWAVFSRTLSNTTTVSYRE